VSDGDEEGTSERVSDPVLRILNSDATPEEVAALVAVFAALSAGTRDTPAASASSAEWNAPHRLVRSRQQHGPGGWRASGLPR
jgi:hypothetical protein